MTVQLKQFLEHRVFMASVSSAPSNLPFFLVLWGFWSRNGFSNWSHSSAQVIPSLLKPAPKPGAKSHDKIAFISVRWEKETQQKSTEDVWTGRVILCNLSTGKTISGNLAKVFQHPSLLLFALPFSSDASYCVSMLNSWNVRN